MMDEEAPIIELHTSMLFELPPSCIEFYPLQPEYFVVGTYSLDSTLETNSDSMSTY